LFGAYARDALAAKRYDFHMGRKLKPCLERSGFSVSKELILGDEELSFTGPARKDVVDAWEASFDRMKLLRDLAGAGFDRMREEFLRCLSTPEHRSTAKVFCCIARR
jgi:hypothetical protein